MDDLRVSRTVERFEVAQIQGEKLDRVCLAGRDEVEVVINRSSPDAAFMTLSDGSSFAHPALPGRP